MTLSPTIADYLFRHGAAYALEFHMPSSSSLESAREAGIDEESLAKSVVLQDDASSPYPEAPEAPLE